jgi:hypothetical protein
MKSRFFLGLMILQEFCSNPKAGNLFSDFTNTRQSVALELSRRLNSMKTSRAIQPRQVCVLNRSLMMMMMMMMMMMTEMVSSKRGG